MSTQKQLHIGVFLQGVGHSIAWRHPDHAKFTEFETYVRFAQTAERGKLDFIFFGEGLVVREHRDQIFGPIVNGRPDTLALLPALAAVTNHVGLAATISSTYNEPYELARQLASLDHVSAGRAAWNVVTTFSNSIAKDSGGDQVAFNFSREKHLDHATRYARAREFVGLIKQLWDSWEEDAFADGALDPQKIHAINHQDEWFTVRGPLDVPRSPQGHPVIIQAGQSDDGRDLAARIADVIFSPHRNLEDSKAHYDDVKARMRKLGRSPDELRLLPGLGVITAPTAAAAKEKAAYYRELLLTDDIIRYLLGEQSGLDFQGIDLDAPLPTLDTTNPAANVPLIEKWQEQAREQKLTARQVADLIMPRTPVVGSPSQVADHFQHWLEAGASDGFLLTPTLFPNDLDDFVDLVVPELQNRGLFRTEYTGTTLRENLGVPRPASPWGVAQPAYRVA
ncbi:MAG: NtaA/DmoA family FMN-dependent monooxygenase [Caldilineaceae bacterium]|nr:NtaA/DmoA family FMN-dependent monooxygenase [Caldilineaceae bacterium]